MSKTTSKPTHHTFTIERTYPVPPARVFRAWADPRAKRRWFVEGEGWEIEHFEMDFRVGGVERARFRYQGGPPISYDTWVMDIVPDARIVTAYGMTMDGAPLSASLATLTFEAVPGGTRLVYTEQAAFFMEGDHARLREGGCVALLDKLAEEVARPA